MNHKPRIKIMNKRILLIGLTLALTGIGRAGLYYDGTGGIIPDNSTAGATWTISSSVVGAIDNVSVVFNMKNGFNGDLVGYLTYDDGSSKMTQMLLNRIGGGSSSASGSGFGTGASTTDYASLLSTGVRMVDGGAGGNIHNVAPGAGNYVAVGNYTPDSGLTFSTTFGGMSGSGTWTLFFADMAAGDQSTLVSWGLDITPVPEPVNVALGILGGVSVLVFVVRSRPVRTRLRRWQVAANEWIDAV
jgi:hypothetical protein